VLSSADSVAVLLIQSAVSTPSAMNSVVLPVAPGVIRANVPTYQEPPVLVIGQPMVL